MTTSLNDLSTRKALDLTPFEIRGAKSGINNARTTGPVYTMGQYLPASSLVTGVGTLSPVSSGNIVTNFLFDSPYSTLNTFSLRAGSSATTGDSVIIGGASFFIREILTSNSFRLDRDTALNGNYSLSFNLIEREYVVEPDVASNTTVGVATFTYNDSTVTNSFPYSFYGIASGDFIKSGNYQNYFRIKTYVNTHEIVLTSPFSGLTQTGDYTSKKWTIGETEIQYSKNDISYDNLSAKWKYDSITAGGINTSTDSSALSDGISLRFTHSLTTTAPDIMDVATVVNKVLARKTQYEMPQFSLPVVPYPETMTLFINDATKDQFPYGNQEYVLTYSQSPMYEPPPPPKDRHVANIMFLKKVKNVQPSTILTSSGQFQFTDTSGVVINGIMPGSEQLYLNNSLQVPYRDYILEPNVGVVEIIDSTVNEPIVKYVDSNYSSFIDYGFSIYLNGVKQNISFPSKPTDDVLFQPFSGLLKPQGQDHPGPEDVYEVNYMVAATNSKTENIQGTVGQTVLKTLLYPIKQNSIFLSSGDTFLSEGTDYIVSYLTGAITLSTPLASSSSITITYTPLSKQVNALTYSDSTSYCTVYESRAVINNTSTFDLSIVNKSLDLTKVNILRVYNETRNADYGLGGLIISSNTFKLQMNPSNVAIGMNSSDVITIDYKFPSATTEYAPVEINYFNLSADSSSFYLEGSNITPYLFSGSLINLISSDSVTQYIFAIDSSSFDGYGTKVNLTTTIPVDIVNPALYISDASVSFIAVPYIAGTIVSGITNVTFSGNVSNFFRSNSILKIENDFYRNLSASYDSNTGDTVLSITPSALHDYTGSGILSSIKISDTPVYLEGDTEIYSYNPIVTILKQPAFIINNNNDEVLTLNSDATALNIDGTSFLYSSYPNLLALNNAITAANISALSLINYVPLWQSNKILPVSNVSIFSNSNTVLYADSALRYNDMDSSNYTISDAGTVLLTNPLQKQDRYNLDYMGQQFLGDAQMKYSVGYFTNLLANSKVAASFQYENLDQFYIQVMDQKDFFENVTVPRMQEEANQLNGNVGQGGDIPGDTGQENSEGGLSGDEFRRQDADIECRVFKNVYDFFQDRLNSYGVEMEAAIGPRLFNNDGTFSESQQLAANMSINRIFSRADYTNMEPQICNPLTGYYFDTGAIFSQGSNDVWGVDTQWLLQLGSSTGFIGRSDSTKRYLIDTVIDSTHLKLIDNFTESSTIDLQKGDSYTGSVKFPIYDDDGYLGPKFIGTKNGDFHLTSGDTFKCNIDGSDWTYTFLDPDKDAFLSYFIGALIPPMPFAVINTLLRTFPPPVSELTPTQIAEQLTSNIPGLKASVESVIDSAQNYGYRTTMVLRAADGTNFLSLPDSTVVEKLGFTGDMTSIGNYNRISHSPEIFSDTTELNYINMEQSTLYDMYGAFNRLDRLTFLSSFFSATGNENLALNNEISKLSSQIIATTQLVKEPTIEPSYTDATNALINANDALNQANNSLSYNATLQTLDWIWPIDFTEMAQDATDINGLMTVTITAPYGNNKRILNAIVAGNLRTPVILFANDLSPVGGVWSGWDPAVGSQYSINEQIQFTMTDTTLFSIIPKSPSVVVDATYYANPSNLSLFWNTISDSSSAVFSYDSSSVLDIKTAIDSSTDFTAIGPAIYNSNYAMAFKLGSGYMTPDATIYAGLRDCIVSYQTISDRLLNDRFAYTFDRSNFLINTRLPYLSQREQQIITDMGSEEILRTSTGNPGDLYTWANNRFNRRQGCYARLKQIEQQIASNQSALSINKSFM